MKKAAEIHDREMMNLRCGRIQVDEIWTFVAKKQAHLKPTEKSNTELGDQYVFVGMYAQTKIVPSYRIGKRTSELTVSFLTDLRTRIINTFQLSSDSFRAYKEAVDKVFGCRCSLRAST